MDLLTCVVIDTQLREHHSPNDAACTSASETHVSFVFLTKMCEAHMTPKLMLPASMIFSRRGIRKDQINNQGKIAKKKSQALDQAERYARVSLIAPEI